MPARVKISKGNSKIGRTMNVSLPAVVTCVPGCPCAKSCYARRRAAFRKNVAAAWLNNLRALEQDRELYFQDIFAAVMKRRPEYFRWHVSGDIPDQDYLDRMKVIAKVFPETRFLVFTKRYTLSYARTPKNLAVIFSAWPGYKLLRKRHRVAWMQDGTETRVPADAIRCPGSCETCGMCWDLPNIGRDVVFHKH